MSPSDSISPDVPTFASLADAEFFRATEVAKSHDMDLQLQKQIAPDGSLSPSPEYERWAVKARAAKTHCHRRIGLANAWIKEYRCREKQRRSAAGDHAEKLKEAAYAASDYIRHLESENSELRARLQGVTS